MSFDTTLLYQIRAMVASIMKQNNAAKSTGSAIDFAVDMFDRADAEGLGGYWSDTTGSWAIRSNQAVPFSRDPTGVAQDTLINSLSSTYAGLSIVGYSGVSNQLGATPRITNSYLGSLPPNFTAAIVFNVANTVGAGYIAAVEPAAVAAAAAAVAAAAAAAAVSAADGGYAYAAYTAAVAAAAVSAADAKAALAALNGVISVQASQVAAAGYGQFNFPASVAPALVTSAGIICGGTGAGIVGACVAVADTVPIVGATQTFPGGVLANSEFGDMQGFSFPVETIGPAGETPSTMIVVGQNTMVLTATGNTYAVTLNDYPYYTSNSAWLGSRSTAGICAHAINSVAASIKFGYAFAGISSFKAWNSAIPEPLDESGNGTFVNGAHVYSDRYHTLDADGTGYVYNPNA
jgi:hypothetical protein